MDDQTAGGADEVSPASMQFLEQDLASPSSPLKSQSGYPYGGWASATLEPVAASNATASSAVADSSINLLA